MRTNHLQGSRRVALLLVITSLAATAPAAALAVQTGRYVFDPNQSTILQTGGFAGVNWTHTLEGQFCLSVDPSAGLASFTHIDARAVDPGQPLRFLDPNQVFNLTALLGTVLDDTTIEFTGRTADGSTVLLTLTLEDDMAHLTGQTTPPPNTADFFVFAIDARARRKYAGGTGDPNTPYRIATTANLIAAGETPEDYDKHFMLTADIDLDPNLPAGRVFTRAVIAPDVNGVENFQGTAFTGIFSGCGHKIKCLTIEGGTARYLGLFGKMGRTGSVRDLILENARVSSSGYCIGGLVGYNRGAVRNCQVEGTLSGGTGDWCSCLGLLAGRNIGELLDCHVNGKILTAPASRGSRLGMLAGQNWGSTSNCTAQGSVVIAGGSYLVGGLVGENLGSLSDCPECHVSIDSEAGAATKCGGLVGSSDGALTRCGATGDISCGAYSKYVGGLVGLNGGTILSCFATGDVSGDHANYQFGGLVGLNYGQIVHSFAEGSVTAVLDVGGLVGENSYGNLSHCYSIGRVVGGPESYMRVGGLVAYSKYGRVSRCFWDITTSEMTTSDGGIGLPTIRMQDSETFLASGWDFTAERANGTAGMWAMLPGGGYPALAAFSDSPGFPPLVGVGTAEDPYQIATGNDLGAINRHNTRASFRLTADIDLGGIAWTTPVIPSFEGMFDGDGFTISNLHIRGQEFLGLFGTLWRGAVIKNVKITDASIAARDNASAVGILAAVNHGRISDCHIRGTITGAEDRPELAGVVGHNFGTVIDCDPIGYHGPYTVVVTSAEATAQFLNYEGIDFDQVWIPETVDFDGLKSALAARLDGEGPMPARWWVDREHILAYLNQYSREYSGFIRDNRKYIICNMILLSGAQGSFFVPGRGETGTEFTIIMDGGCGIVRVIFDAETKQIIAIECNGMA